MIRRFLPAVILVVLVVASAPFMGLIRDVLFDRFDAAAVRYLALALLTLAAAVFLYAIARIRHHRLLRYSGLGLAALLLWLQETVLSAGISDTSLAARVAVAEKIHLVEYGLLAYLLYRAFKPPGTADLAVLLLPLLWLTVAGVLEESMQWLVETRLGEIRDVFLNLYAGVCGLLFSLSLDPPNSSPEGGQTKHSPEGGQTKHFPERGQTKHSPEGGQTKHFPEGGQTKGSPEGGQTKHFPEGGQTKPFPEGGQTKHFAWRLGAADRRRAGDAAGLAVLALGLFFSFAHLGYEHKDPEIGRFLSWHSLEELRDAAADRSRRWSDDPPTELSPWRREDYFLTEASWHVNHRNGSYKAGNHYLAANANRILEKHYAPFLDLESFRGSGKHRYPPEVLRELEAKTPPDPERYRSPVLEIRIYTWPSKGPFLAVLFAVALAIWLVPRVVPLLASRTGRRLPRG